MTYAEPSRADLEACWATLASSIVAVQEGEDSSRSPELGEDVTHVACNRRRTMRGWRYVLL